MDIRQITPTYFVSPQISAEDVAQLPSLGFTCVICNRPDTEIPPSHHADAIKDAVEAAGMTFVVNPLTHDSMTHDRLSLQRESWNVLVARCLPIALREHVPLWPGCWGMQIPHHQMSFCLQRQRVVMTLRDFAHI